MAPESKGPDDEDEAQKAARTKSEEDSEQSREDNETEEEETEGEDEDEEPQLKYASLTKAQGALYRNGDAASAFLVAGDKMVRVCTARESFH